MAVVRPEDVGDTSWDADYTNEDIRTILIPRLRADMERIDDPKVMGGHR